MDPDDIYNQMLDQEPADDYIADFSDLDAHNEEMDRLNDYYDQESQYRQEQEDKWIEESNEEQSLINLSIIESNNNPQIELLSNPSESEEDFSLLLTN